MLSVPSVTLPGWSAGFVALPRLFFVVRLCPDEGTGIQDKKRASEVL